MPSHSTPIAPIVHLKMNSGKECSRAECARLRSRLHCVTTRRVASTRQGVRSAPQFDFRHRPASCAAFQSARGLAHSKTLRVCRGHSAFPWEGQPFRLETRQFLPVLGWSEWKPNFSFLHRSNSRRNGNDSGRKGSRSRRKQSWEHWKNHFSGGKRRHSRRKDRHSCWNGGKSHRKNDTSGLKMSVSNSGQSYSIGYFFNPQSWAAIFSAKSGLFLK
jgi:hypothetical protein